MSKYKQYCNICGCETNRDDNDVFEGGCPYHQKTITNEEGSYQVYDEFDQDGEAWQKCQTGVVIQLP